MSEQEGAARRRRVPNPWVIALHAGGVALVAVGIVLHALFWKDNLLGMYAGYGSELASGMTEEQFLRTLAAGQLATELVPVCIGAGIAAVLGALALQAVVWEQRMRMRASA
ncbi:hypothetical protein [Arenivirga flava]|uniref:Uncharacterized protein n=1 Tax=Arenivirga flava TaxID=1930060 RepID=A0AA37UIK1_9MICO|nr:hypothetical protein [Arenivirga flava]GMA29629.1 hypothetical protein GCM10025874_28820 [Arenivirga flava]